MSLRYDPNGGECLGKEQPGLLRLRDYTLKTYAGTSLGIYACRPVRGGTSLSMHAEGRAFDWRAPERRTLEDAIGFLLANADALSIQVITDYQKDRRWKVGKGWRIFTGSDPGGPAWHVERNWDGANDTRAIEDLLKGKATPVSRQYDPPLQSVASVACPIGPGAWLYSPDNGLQAVGGAPFDPRAQLNDKDWFVGRKVARIDPTTNPGKWFTVVATSGEKYDLPE